ALNAIRKYVFSDTLAEATWTNTTIVRGDVATSIRELKEQGDGDLVMYGLARSAKRCSTTACPTSRALDPPAVRRPRQPALPAGRKSTTAAPRHRGARKRRRRRHLRAGAVTGLSPRRLSGRKRRSRREFKAP